MRALLAAIGPRPTAATGRVISLALGGIGGTLLVQALLSYLIVGYPAYVGRPMQPVVAAMFMVGLPTVLLLGAGASYWAARRVYRPAFGTMVVVMILTTLAAVGTGDDTVAISFILLFNVMVSAYQLKRAGARIACAIAALGAAAAVGTQQGLAAGLINGTVIACVAGTATSMMARARDQQDELFAQLERRASVDSVSGAATRTVFAQRAAESLSGGSGTGLLLVDLDHFKLFNDTHGHAAGDRLLRHVCRLLLKSSAEGDLVARMGGDELAVLMPRIGAQESADRARRIFAAISNQPLIMDDGSLVPYTLSVGVGHAVSGTVEALYQAADDGLYRAKSAGRGTLITDRPAVDSAGEPAAGQGSAGT